MRNKKSKVFAVEVETRLRECYKTGLNLRRWWGGWWDGGLTAECIHKAKVVGNHLSHPHWDLIIGKACSAIFMEAAHGLKCSRGCKNILWNSDQTPACIIYSLSLFLSWHLNLPLPRELAGRTRALESAQGWILTLSWINSIISNVSFPQPKPTLKWNRGLFLICRSIIRRKWNNMCLSTVSVLLSYHIYFSLSGLLEIICYSNIIQQENIFLLNN